MPSKTLMSSHLAPGKLRDGHASLAGRRNRLWSVAATVATIMVVAPLVQIVTVIALLFVFFPEATRTEDVEANIEALAANPGAALLLFIPFQLTALGFAMLAGRLSIEPIVQRLGWRRPQLGPIDYLLASLGTFFVACVGGAIIGVLFYGPNANTVALGEWALAPAGAWVPVLFIVGAILPGFCEETLCRGYIQRRLLKRWNPWAAITVASLGFAAIHLDIQHIVAVIPLSLWWGYVAWRSNSIWISIVCHTVNNLIWIAVTRYLGPAGTMEFWTPSSSPLSVCVLLLTGSALVLSARRLWMHRSTLP